MTLLTKLLIRRINATGPITIADYMSECLLHPEHGYYQTHDPFGVDGDFTTAPEISQMFGELIGLCVAQNWLATDGKPRFTLAELGPGRGTLMADILRATKSIPGFHDAAEIHMVEASDSLIQRQKKTLPDYDVTWISSVDELPDQSLFLIANEFFDALPIRQFIRDPNGWRERQIGVSDGNLTFGLSDAAPIALLDDRLEGTEPNDVVETCPSAAPIMSGIADRIRDHGGMALIVDYGHWRSFTDTFQAVRKHEMVDPLAHCGDADLTAHVDFEAIAKATSGVAISDLVNQGTFLERLGITERAQTLAKNLSGAALDSHIAAHRRLTHPAEMGTLFKVMAIYQTGSPVPAGLAP